ncbi:MAG TPA: response regulator, partial [Verrucomicrobia bacterium]|nr:response regulator [Verrucomicrobiota bacterium]
LDASGRLNDQEGRISIRTGSVQSTDREGLNLDTDWGLGNEDLVYIEVESFRIDSAVELADSKPTFNGVVRHNEISGMVKSSIDRVLKECCGGLTYQVKSGDEAIYRIFFSTVPTVKPPTTELEDLPDDWKCSGTVLIADDEELVRNAMARFLVSLGMKVLKCSNGREAVRKFQESNADVRFVILDYSMPSLNGLETMKSILHIRHDMKVILSSGYQELLMQQLPDYTENIFSFQNRSPSKGFSRQLEQWWSPDPPSTIPDQCIRASCSRVFYNSEDGKPQSFLWFDSALKCFSKSFARAGDGRITDLRYKDGTCLSCFSEGKLIHASIC